MAATPLGDCAARVHATFVIFAAVDNCRGSGSMVRRGTSVRRSTTVGRSTSVGCRMMVGQGNILVCSSPGTPADTP